MTDLVNDDIRHWAATYTGPAFHALLCDAPYEMAFMGKSWDASGIAFDPQTGANFTHIGAIVTGGPRRCIDGYISHEH